MIRLKRTFTSKLEVRWDKREREYVARILFPQVSGWGRTPEEAVLALSVEMGGLIQTIMERGERL